MGRKQPPPMTDADITEYQQSNAALAQWVKEHLHGLVTTGRALREIRDRRLYRGRFKSFEEYAEQRHDMVPRDTNRLIDIADAFDEVAVGFTPEKELELLMGAQRVHGDPDRITGKVIRSVARDMAPKPPAERSKPKPEPTLF